MAKGRNFSKEFGSDSNAVIFNETTAAFLGYKDPVGHQLYTFGNDNKAITFTIIGVVKNFNFESLHKDIGPLCFRLGQSTYSTSFKVNATGINSLIPQIQSKWKALAPGMPLSYRFLDDSFTEMYNNEQRVGKLALLFSVLAILIACLGLFGLASYTAIKRTKEIGVRKVLGSSIQNIVVLLSKDLLKPVLLGTLIAVPIGYFVMNKWLQSFAYRIGIHWWMFAIAALTAVLIALTTVSFQAIKAALANPTKSLRTE